MNWLGQASEHEADHGEENEGGGRSGVTLEVAGEAPVAADPRQGSLDDPAFGKDGEAMELIALDDFEFSGTGSGDGGGGFGSLVAGIGEDTHDEGEEAAGAPIEDERRTVAILHIGRMNDDVQQEAERIDEDMPLAAPDLLAGIIPLRIERGARF